MVDRWSDDRLDDLTSRADPLVDEIVRMFQEDEEPDEDPRELIGQLVRHGSECSHAGFIADYHNAPIELPDWADVALLHEGQAFFDRWSLQLASSLFYASLPHAYGVSHGAKVLLATGRLADETDLTRRIAETGQFLIDAFTAEQGPTGEPLVPLSSETKGHRAVRNVRLFHAAVRYWINARSDEENEGIGVPINQEDLLGTLLSFTIAAFDALDRMHVPYSDAGARAYLHTWCVIGVLIGIEPALLPLDRDEATVLAQRIAKRHQQPSPEGRELTRALLEDGQGDLWPIIDELPAVALYHLAGEEIAQLHGVRPPPRWLSMLAGLVSRLNPVLLRVGRSMSLNTWFGRRILNFYITKERGKRPPWSFGSELDRHRSAPGRALNQLRGGLSGRAHGGEPHRPPSGH